MKIIEVRKIDDVHSTNVSENSEWSMISLKQMEASVDKKNAKNYNRKFKLKRVLDTFNNKTLQLKLSEFKQRYPVTYKSNQFRYLIAYYNIPTAAYLKMKNYHIEFFSNPKIYEYLFTSKENFYFFLDMKYDTLLELTSNVRLLSYLRNPVLNEIFKKKIITLDIFLSWTETMQKICTLPIILKLILLNKIDVDYLIKKHIVLHDKLINDDVFSYALYYSATQDLLFRSKLKLDDLLTLKKEKLQYLFNKNVRTYFLLGYLSIDLYKRFDMEFLSLLADQFLVDYFLFFDLDLQELFMIYDQYHENDNQVAKRESNILLLKFFNDYSIMKKLIVVKEDLYALLQLSVVQLKQLQSKNLQEYISLGILTLRDIKKFSDKQLELLNLDDILYYILNNQLNIEDIYGLKDFMIKYLSDKSFLSLLEKDKISLYSVIKLDQNVVEQIKKKGIVSLLEYMGNKKFIDWLMDE